MRTLLLLAGATALTAALPAAADAQGRGHGRGHTVRVEQQNRVNVNRTRAAQRRLVTIDRNRDGIDDRTGRRYGGAVCPPGLANRTPACVPPGQARRAFREGQVVPQNYGYYTPYDQLLGRVPEAYRTQIPTGYNYIYNGNNVYVVDPRTRVITDIINLLR